MNIMIKLIIYTPQDYVEAVTGHRYTFDKNICAEIGKDLKITVLVAYGTIRFQKQDM